MRRHCRQQGAKTLPTPCLWRAGSGQEAKATSNVTRQITRALQAACPCEDNRVTARVFQTMTGSWTVPRATGLGAESERPHVRRGWKRRPLERTVLEAPRRLLDAPPPKHESILGNGKCGEEPASHLRKSKARKMLPDRPKGPPPPSRTKTKTSRVMKHPKLFCHAHIGQQTQPGPKPHMQLGRPPGGMLIDPTCFPFYCFVLALFVSLTLVLSPHLPF